MKTFKDLINSSQFTQGMINKGYCTKDSMNFIINSLHLQPLQYLLPLSIKRHIIVIMPSKRDVSEILLAFKSYPVCVEFNRFHVKSLLHRIHANDAIAKKLNLQNYTKIRGYVPKNLLATSKIVEIKKDDIPQIRANGDFENFAENAECHKIFEEIRELILTNKANLNRINSQQIDSIPSDFYLGKGAK